MPTNKSQNSEMMTKQAVAKLCHNRSAMFGIEGLVDNGWEVAVLARGMNP